MVGVAPDEGSRRRLPQWMLGISAANQVEGNSDNVEGNEKQSETELSSHDCHSDPSTTRIHCGKQSLLPEKKKVSENSHFLVKCKTKRRKQKAKQVDADSENKILEKMLGKKYNTTEGKPLESASRKKGKLKDFGSQSSEDIGIQPRCQDEDVELTVEDLITIAEEYVRADKAMDQDQVAKRTCEPRIRPSATISSREESKDCNDGHLATAETGASSHQASSTPDGHGSASYKANSSTETIPINTRATGDPAQDMLDLFLGPLLRKPVGEKKTDSVVELGDAAFSQDFRIQSKNSVVREENSPIGKKKSSLKEKVAMFLD